MSELIAQILCAVSDCENKCGVKQKTLFVAFTATPFELSACARSALHQADNLANLRLEVLSLLELIAQILCAVSDCENKCGVKQ